MKRINFLIIALFLCAGAVLGQPRPADTSSKQPTVSPSASAPVSFEAKYEGGMFGYSSKQMGMLKFDDDNDRLVFFGKDQKEKFHIPYKAVTMIYPQSKSVTSTAGHVVSHIPYPGSFLGGLIKEKRRYLVMHFSDPDVAAANGLVNFKLDNKELVDSILRRLADKANLTQRGEAYYRPKPIKGEI